MDEYVHAYINICINNNKEGIKREIRTNAWNPGIMMYCLTYGFKFRTTKLLHQKQSLVPKQGCLPRKGDRTNYDRWRDP